MSRATEIADAITKNWIGTPPGWAVDAQNELRRLDAEMAKLIEGAGVPAHHLIVDGECIGYYSASQVAAAVAQERAYWHKYLLDNFGLEVK